MLLDRDTRRSPRTRVLAVITRRSAHCSLLHTHKPGSPLLPCLGRTPMPLEPVPQPMVRLLTFKELPPVPQVHGPLLNPEIPNLNPGMSFSDSTTSVSPRFSQSVSGRPNVGTTSGSPRFGQSFSVGMSRQVDRHNSRKSANSKTPQVGSN
jgi:hypothetical protein